MIMAARATAAEPCAAQPANISSDKVAEFLNTIHGVTAVSGKYAKREPVYIISHTTFYQPSFI